MVVGGILGASSIGYPLGVRNEGIKCNIMWDINDVYQSERLASAVGTKEQLLNDIQVSAIDRHRQLMKRIYGSRIDTYLVRRSPEIQRALDRFEHKAHQVEQSLK
jgi:hypothetical protein